MPPVVPEVIEALPEPLRPLATEYAAMIRRLSAVELDALFAMRIAGNYADLSALLRSKMSLEELAEDSRRLLIRIREYREAKQQQSDIVNAVLSRAIDAALTVVFGAAIV